MKRIFTLLLAGTMSLMASAQISSMEEIRTDRAYTIYNPNFTTYAVYNAEQSTSLVWAAGMTADNAINESYKTPLDPKAPSSSWMIVNFKNKWYVYNLGAQKFLAIGYNPLDKNTAPAKIQDLPIPVEFTKNNRGFTLRSHEGDKNFLCAAPQLNYPISIWNNMDNGSTWEIKENLEVEADYATCLAKLEEAFPEMVALNIDTRHGYVWGTYSGGDVPNSIVKGRDFTFYTRARYGWNCPAGVTITHGDEQYVVKNIKEGAYATEITIPAEKVNGDITISGVWERDESIEKAQRLVFAEEFEGTGEPSDKVWSRTQRQGSTWNRWCSDSPLVVFQKDGSLHCRAIPNPDTATDNVPMITGGIKSQGKFAFQWGRVEARIKTIAHRGTFPAFWLMPDKTVLGWPKDGEIDIWEAIDTDGRAYGTVHTHWTYDLGKGGNGGNMGGIDYTRWHVYAIDWDETSITWYVDNKKMWTYKKSTDPKILSQGQWPFDRQFYLILNQSVGNGSWAANADTSFSYETLFDWVRVYQKNENTTGIDDVIPSPENMPTASDNVTYDLSGRKVANSLQKGVFVSNGRLIVR